MWANWVDLEQAPLFHAGVLSWLFKLTALCLIAAATAAIIQRRSAGLAHRIWIWSIAGICFLPVLELIVPRLNLPVQTAAAAIGSAQLPDREMPGSKQTVSSQPIDSRAGATNFEQTSAPETQEPARPITGGKSAAGATISSAPVATPETAPIPEEPAATSRGLGWMQIVCLIWIAVAVFLLMRLVAAFAALASLVKRSPVAPRELQTFVDDMARSLFIHQKYEVRILPRASMPMACWLGRWLILLPRDICDWPSGVRQTVIAHELGHIARRDAWSDFLIQLAWRACWFHPLLWLARHRATQLRERACDEWVLTSSSIPPREYARHLLEVVTRCSRPAHALAPAMARGHELEGRLLSIVSGRAVAWSRKPAARFVTILCCLLLSGLLAAVHAVPSDAQAVVQEGDAGIQTKPIRLAAEPVATDGPAITVGGVVVTPEGRPIAQATVILRIEDPYFYSMGVMNNRDTLAEFRTDAEGRFHFEKIGIPPRHERQIKQLLANKGGARVIVWAEGRALAWTEVKGLAEQSPHRLVLEPEAKVTGIVRDKTGHALKDVRISLQGITKATTRIDQMLSMDDDLRLFYTERCPEAVTTNQDGRFTLHHLPVDRRTMALFRAPGLARTVIVIDTGNDANLKETVPEQGSRDKPMPILHAPAEVVLEPALFATVRVVDSSGQPVRAGVIQAINADRTGGGNGQLDAKGEANVRLDKPGSYEFVYAADPLTPLLGESVRAEVAAGPNQPIINIRLPQSKWLTGQVVDGDTGKSVAGAYVSYAKTSKPGSKDDSQWSMAVSGTDGNFRIPVAIGPGSLGFIHPVFGYFPPTHENTRRGKEPDRIQINIPESGEPQAVILSLGKGLQIRGKIVDANDKPVAAANVAFYPDDSWPDTSTTTDNQGRFELSGLSPFRSGKLIAQALEGSAVTKVEANPEASVTQTLRKDLDIRLKQGSVIITGRVLHNGKPRAGVLMKLTHTIGKPLPIEPFPGNRGDRFTDPNRFFPAGEVRTDADGRYRIGGVESGERFAFQIVDPEKMRDDHWPYQNDGAYSFNQTVPDKQSEVHLPDVNLVALGQTLRGVVVDPKGKPVPGVSVSASLADGQPLSRRSTGETPWTESDLKGKFELRDLPDLPIELMAYKNNPGDRFIKFTTRVRPKLNQQDIRIVLDPRLHETIESLDEPKKPAEVKKE